MERSSGNCCERLSSRSILGVDCCAAFKSVLKVREAVAGLLCENLEGRRRESPSRCFSDFDFFVVVDVVDVDVVDPARSRIVSLTMETRWRGEKPRAIYFPLPCLALPCLASPCLDSSFLRSSALDRFHVECMEKVPCRILNDRCRNR